MNQWDSIYVIVPTLLLALIFWFVMRNIFNADKNERKAYAKAEAEERARRGLPPKDS